MWAEWSFIIQNLEKTYNLRPRKFPSYQVYVKCDKNKEANLSSVSIIDVLFDAWKRMFLADVVDG